jgi:hypothetical protein
VNDTPEEIAKRIFSILENDEIAKRKFLTANYNKSTWLQCPPFESQSVDFWQYGPPIPNVSGYIYPLAEVWYHGAKGGWVVSFPPKPAGKETYEFDQAKVMVEMTLTKKWGLENGTR